MSWPRASIQIKYTNGLPFGLHLEKLWRELQVRLLTNVQISNPSAKEPGSCSQKMCTDNSSSRASMFVLGWIVFYICFAANECTTKILESKNGHCSSADGFFFQIICTFDLSHFSLPTLKNKMKNQVMEKASLTQKTNEFRRF